ncbi:hypothetical protein [Rummeliibacillus sp. SL167]|uniref:hypothetical protein n=1 Tax=Rummeliibacillus sp. SL167 TaxID=2579792 RepID=UPI0011B784F8|nr:hypothetical protein [Rummeliibacillus sp. SL167]
MKKLLLATTTLSLLFLNASIGASAAESEDYTEYDVARPIISPYVIDLSGYEYIHSSTSKNKKVEFTHTHSNNSSSTDTVSYSVGVTQSTTANVTSNASFKTMVAEAGVSTQVGLGTTKTKTLTITWSIPAKTTYQLRAGSNWVKETGTEKLWNAGKVIKSKSVSGNWTYSSWSDKIKK